EVCELLEDGTSWSTVVEEGKPVDSAGSGATTLAIRAMTSWVGRSTLGGGFGTSLELIVAGVIHEVRVLNFYVQKRSLSNLHELF
nr:hypothetical protein [Tanacetum cinerariifolium]